MKEAQSRAVTFDDGHVEEQWLVGFSDGTLLAAQREAVLAHLDVCERCREVIGALARDVTSPHGAAAEPFENAAVGSDTFTGRMLGEYRVLEKLSEGGMGAVYRGIQPVISRPVAIKVLLPGVAKDAEHAHRLLAEARAVNAIHHPNIVDIFSFGTLDDGSHYIVMELLSGQPLSVLMRARRLSLPDVLSLLEQATGALAAAHAAGVLHRDLKPSNLFVTPLDGRLHLTVLDFGVAKGLYTPITSILSLPGAILGTPGYMAPEQIRGQPLGPTTDLYAMGVIAFQMLTGTDPFSAVADIDLLKAHLTQPVPALKSRGVEVPPALEALVIEMLEKDATRRPSALEVRRRLEKLQRQEERSPFRPSIVAEAPARAPAPLPQRRRRWPLVVGLLVAGAAALAIISALARGG